MPTDTLELFSAATRSWFTTAFDSPTEAQERTWQATREGEHTLVVAPTGSGKTLAAFLWALDRLSVEEPATEHRHNCRVLYVSPLKALAVDVQRNLRDPLAGIKQAAERHGQSVRDITVGMRTGDTPTAERRSFARSPTDILVTTPESLFLLLTSAARDSLRGIRTVIVDEVHALAGNKRGAHLAVSLERLDELLQHPAQRIGLSATVRPVDEVTSFLAGNRPVRVVAPEHPKMVEMRVEVPVADMTAPDEPVHTGTTTAAGDESERDTATGRAPSIWPAVEHRILELIRTHRSTIVFTNSRRLTERLTSRLNELATGDTELTADERYPAQVVGQSGITVGFDEERADLAKAHHGSMSRERRTRVEEELKTGELPCVVATSSLELGIDMGAVDLVVQVEAPPSVSSGLQRVGRSGHRLGAASSGVMFPKFRGDLVSCAVVAERMAAGSIEALHYPRNPLDVLAQHIVAAVALDSRTVDDLIGMLRRAAPFAALPDDAAHSVLDMLAGRYPSEEFGQLRARITWDRIAGKLHGRPGAQRLAVTAGGTIPDRGLFTVTTPAGDDATGSARGGGRRVGELDEEMVYESRPGDTILLGTSSWHITDITNDRVIVVPAPGKPARMPFWHGDAVGRPLELGRAQGALLRELTTTDQTTARHRCSAAGLDSSATNNLLAYIAEQRAATRHVPTDRTLLLERFRDELGDWRVVLHSPFGAQVNAPWALVLSARLRDRHGIDVRAAHSDDGIVLRLPESHDDEGREITVDTHDLLLDPDEVEQVVTTELGSSALFAARFRECAARSLLLPRHDPRRRSPLWQQRHRAAQLLEVATKYERFPVALEAMRECLQDVYDVAGLRELMTDIRARRIRILEVHTNAASPFARNLLFGYVGMFLYENDAPLAERRSAALSLDSNLLAELLGTEAVRELLDPGVVSATERSLQRLDTENQPRGPEDTADLLRFLGDLTEEEAVARGVAPQWLRELESARRAIRVPIGRTERYVAIEDASRMRDALGTPLPTGIPDVFTEPVHDPVGDLLIRYARCHVPFSVTQAAQRFELSDAVVGDVADRLTTEGRLVRGELGPEPSGTVEYCDPGVLRRLRRASLAKLRAAVEPVEPDALGRFLPSWHGIEPTGELTGTTADDVLAVVEQLAGAPLPASALESLILPCRLPGYQPAMLDELTAAGEVTWVGCGSLPGGDGWISLAPTDTAELVLPMPAETPVGALHTAIVAALDSGALFFRQLNERIAPQLDSLPEDGEVIAALWDLVWAGVVTGDTLAPLRALLAAGGTARTARGPASTSQQGPFRTHRSPSRIARPAMPSRSGPPMAAGRWTLTPVRDTDPTRRAHSRTEVFLARHGVLTRGALDTEHVTGGFAGIYRVLREMENSAKVVRGYVLEGLGAAQFATRGAVDRLRSHSSDHGYTTKAALVLAATDPAQPYGAALAWPETVGATRHRPARKAGASAVLVDGMPVLYVERGGRSLLSFTRDEDMLRAAATTLSDAVTRGLLGQLSLQRADGEQVLTSRLAPMLRESGFRATPKGLRLRG